jgi:tetratricopeptide (TPR) repeat protein
MKPMGTITKYYPFIEEETKSILNSLMDESSSYYDFVQRLCNVILKDEVSVNLVYVAAVQAWWCRTEETKSLIQEKYKDVPCIRPWGYLHYSSQTHQVKYHDAVVEAIEKAMETSLDDWMVTELHLLHTFYHWPIHGDIPSYLEPLEKAKSLTDANPLLNCFEPLICAFEGMAKRREGYTKDALAIFQRGQELAEVHDDSLYKYMNLSGQARVLMYFNIHDSLARFEELYVLVQDLEVPYLESDMLHDSGVAYETAGEYDLAISSHLEKMNVLGRAGLPEPMRARVYATLGYGQQALDLINGYFERFGHPEVPILYLRKAWALALLNRLEEAEQNLDTAQSLLITYGSEWQLGIYYHVSGVIELARGDFLAALDFLEKAWEVSERIPRDTNQNRALLDLARAEILIDNQSKDSTKVVVPGKWLSKLEKFATERDLPGVRMQTALLKSEFYQNHGQLKDAHATLQDALDITDSLGVATLRKRISDRIQEINRLMQDEELVS